MCEDWSHVKMQRQQLPGIVSLQAHFRVSQKKTAPAEQLYWWLVDLPLTRLWVSAALRVLRWKVLTSMNLVIATFVPISQCIFTLFEHIQQQAGTVLRVTMHCDLVDITLQTLGTKYIKIFWIDRPLIGFPQIKPMRSLTGHEWPPLENSYWFICSLNVYHSSKYSPAQSHSLILKPWINNNLFFMKAF